MCRTILLLLALFLVGCGSVGQSSPAQTKTEALKTAAEPEALVSSAWYIDSVAGSDTNPGTTEAPLQHVAEWARRIKGGVLQPPVVLDPQGSGDTAAFVDVFVENNDLLTSDPISFEATFGQGVVLRFWGLGASTVYSGTIGALTPKNTSLNIPWSFQDIGIPSTWAALGLAMRVRDTAAPRQNLISWDAKDLGSQTARFSDFGVRSIRTQGTITITPPVTGDTYVVEQLRRANIGEILVNKQDNTGAAPTLMFIDLELSARSQTFSGPSITSNSIGLDLKFSGCRFVNTGTVAILAVSGFGSCQLWNCGFASGFILWPYIATMRQGLALGTDLHPFPAGEATFQNDAMLQGTSMTVYPGTQVALNGAALFDAPGPGVVVQPGAVLNIGSGSTAWGSGNGSYGIRVYEGGSVSYSGAVPTITGASGDFLLGGSSVGWSFNAASATWIPVGGLPCTWMNLALPEGPTGFGGSASNPGQQCGVYKHL